MSKRDTKKEPEIAVASADEVAKFAESAPGQDGKPATADAPADADALRAERDEWQEKALRAKADLKNLQRRTQTERQQAVQFANTEFARSLLVILDDIGRTLDAGRKDTDRDTLLKSVEILNDHMRKILASNHVKPIEADGATFDPALHQAIAQHPSDDHEPGTIVEVLEAGYMLHDRVLRPAKVVVAAGESDAEPTGDSPDNADV